MSDPEQWPPARSERNREAVEYYRSRGQAPGVAEGGGTRNVYCMSCDGVIPITYDRSRPASGETRTCPHCGVELDARVQRMFNWVEIDQVHDSDLKALLPLLLGGAVVALGLLLWWLL